MQKDLIDNLQGLNLGDMTLADLIEELLAHREASQVHPFETAPRDGTPILAFHKIWKCWIDIQRRDGAEQAFPECHWIDCTFTNVWPSDAFTHWREMPPPPDVAVRRKAPWPDFRGNDIYDGDTIIHPTGERGAVIYMDGFKNDHDKWRVIYHGEESILSRLSLQIGDKGQAVVESLPGIQGNPDKPGGIE